MKNKIYNQIRLTAPIALSGWFNPFDKCEESGLGCGTFYGVLLAIMQFGLGILTIVAIIGFIISGLMYITAGGAGKADEAKKWLTYSIIGVIVGTIGYIIIRLIFSITTASPEL